MARRGQMWLGRQGEEWHDAVRLGMTRNSTAGMARQGQSELGAMWHSTALQARQGGAWRGPTGLGAAGGAWRG